MKTTEETKSYFSHGSMLCKKRKYGRKQYKKKKKERTHLMQTVT